MHGHHGRHGPKHCLMIMGMDPEMGHGPEMECGHGMGHGPGMGMGPMMGRHFITKEERIEFLEKYRDWLEKEAAGVKEHIEEMKKK